MKASPNSAVRNAQIPRRPWSQERFCKLYCCIIKRKPSESRGEWDAGGADGSQREMMVLRETPVHVFEGQNLPKARSAFN